MHNLIAVTAGWGVIALGVAGLYVWGRDPKADEHDLSDYHEPAPVVPSFSFTLAERGLAQMRDDPAVDDILPPAPPGMNAGSPLYAGMLFDTWYPESPAQVAARFLREIAAVEQDKAGIGPAHDHWVHWDGSCEMDCPGCARDMVGAFPVVRAAA